LRQFFQFRVGLLALLFLFFCVPQAVGKSDTTNSPETAATAIDGSADSQSPGQNPVSSESVSVSELESVDENQTDGNPAVTSDMPVFALAAGVLTILVLMIVFRIHAFIALMIAAFVISCFAAGTGSDFVDRVVAAFGSNAGKVGLVIAMAAIIGKCMLDSGAANCVVDACLAAFGQKRAPTALAGAAFLLGIPVFFDTVFYLLVPLARSLYRNTKKNYLQYILAVAAGGAVTHTLVPPTPGPLFIAAALGVNLGLMILVGAAVGVPCAIAGLLYAKICDMRMPIEMRPLATTDLEPPTPANPPNLFWSMAPIVLPVILISISTILTLIADSELASALRSEDVVASELQAALSEDPAAGDSASIAQHLAAISPEAIDAVQSTSESSLNDETIDQWNTMLMSRDLYDPDVFAEVELRSETESKLAALGERTKLVDVQHAHRLLIEDAFPAAIRQHQWNTPSRQRANWFSLPGNPNFALTIAAFVALFVLWRSQRKTFEDLSKDMEIALLSGSVIILITAAGGAFGDMLRLVEISGWVENRFSNATASGIGVLLLAWGIAATFKVAQGSSTVAMIGTASMVSAILAGSETPVNMVYVATSIGSGSLMGSWMNDSGFWIFAKMGGLTEGETLRSWTVLLGVLSLTGLLATIALSLVAPLV
jgi:H+/gluconate symporter-like permease